MLSKKPTRILLALTDLFLVVFLIIDFGFETFTHYKNYKLVALVVLLALLFGININRIVNKKSTEVLKKSSKVNLLVLTILVSAELVFIYLFYENSFVETFFKRRYVIEYGLLFYFIIRLTFFMRKLYSFYFNPAILFIGSFAVTALGGALLLMLPAATTSPISFTDALFTATSAVTVTGLVVVDTATQFTFFGKAVIMIVFQIGGLGMLTLTSFFAYFFRSGASYKESLYMKDILGNSQLNEIMKTAMQIVAFSLVVEAVGALFIYYSILDTNINHKAFFAIFHAISAYCNAGFSLASDGLYTANIRFNYSLQWVIMALIVFGGLGYHIASNFVQYIKKWFINLIRRKHRRSHQRVITLNTKMVLYTTSILIFVGTLFFMVSERNTFLAEHTSVFGKATTAFFSSITARTAGFNTIDMASFSIPGILVMILLMWIGASPASTGGGIKTTTFALATLNVFTIAKNKPHIEIAGRRIPTEAVRKAFAIITISLICIGIGILLLLIFNPEFTLIQAAFEVFSAYGTVGLSLGVTSELSLTSKYVIMMLMFFGRIGLINLMIGLLRTMKSSAYTYPKENILIN
ncbi:MAG: TrkH family potassium uptake protein [Mesonia hippocampi]|uniref:TrkH family potassium uptake protein n=1 Tax=Mesonia hippocampi TaxID=1628250 RepID=UPI003F99C4D9